MKFAFRLLLISLLLLQCDKKKKTYINKENNNIKYAKGFDIVKTNNSIKLIIKKGFQNSQKEAIYILNKKTNAINKNEIKIPIQNIVATSTTHIPMLELLNSENKLVGFPNTNYVSSKKTRKLIDNNQVVELGAEQNINIEKLIDLKPDLVIGSSLSINKTYQNIIKTKIPVIFNGDWLEETPLGRAEWIKFFGILLNKEKEADSIFNVIEKNYLDAVNIAKLNTKKPITVLSGSMFKDTWNVPAGKSFIATYLKDANLNYLWKNTNGTGSLQLSFESVLDKGKNADFWIGCGLFETKEQLLNSNNHYKEFHALTNNKTYSIGSKKGITGGFIYFELAPVRPDLVLKDFIKITQPNLLPDYQLTFFSLLK